MYANKWVVLFRCTEEMPESAGCVLDLCAMHENMMEEPLQYLPQLGAFPRSLNSGLVRVYVGIFLKTHFPQPFFFFSFFLNPCTR